MEEERLVGHYLYATKEDAEVAAKEKKQAAYLTAHIDLNQRENARKIYEKALQDRIFRTPPGLNFMTRLREGLINAGETEVPPVALYVRFTGGFREREESPRERIKREEKKARAINSKRLSVFLNVVLLALVAGLFYLTLSSPNPNILNYEQALQNKYASWESDLSEREQEVRRMERELGILSGNE